MNYSFYCIDPDDVLRLRDERSFLERQLADVIDLAAAERPKDCEVSWELFSSELLRQMQYEENLFFPAFAKIGTVERLRSELFWVEHDEFRRLCQTLGRELEQNTVNLGLLRQLADKLCSHRSRRGCSFTLGWVLNSTPARLGNHTSHYCSAELR